MTSAQLPSKSKPRIRPLFILSVFLIVLALSLPSYSNVALSEVEYLDSRGYTLVKRDGYGGGGSGNHDGNDHHGHGNHNDHGNGNDGNGGGGQSANNTINTSVPVCSCAFANAGFGLDNVDPTLPHGAINFYQNPCGQTTLQGEFSSGFQQTNSTYKFLVKDSSGNTVSDLTKFIKLRFFNNGAVLPFAATTRNFSLNCNDVTSNMPNNNPAVDYGGGNSPNVTGIPGSFAVTPTILNQGLFLYRDNQVFGAPALIARNAPLQRP